MPGLGYMISIAEMPAFDQLQGQVTVPAVLEEIERRDGRV
jgi:hypothetical protein